MTNINRALTVLQIPGITFLWGEAYEQAEAHVKSLDGHESLSSEEKQLKVFRSFEQKVADKRKNPMEYFYATQNFSTLVDMVGSQIQTPVRSILNSLQIQIYTCFEILCGDLWEAAVNEHPMILAELAGRNKSEKDQLTSVPLRWLTNSKFNIQEKMGTILRAEDKCTFDKLSNIRKSYKRAFSIDYDKIDIVLDRKELDLISASRNVLVHNNGIVDDDFISKSINFPDLLVMKDGISEIKKGQMLKIDGQSFVNLVKFMSATSTALVIAVDEWLKTHDK